MEIWIASPSVIEVHQHPISKESGSLHEYINVEAGDKFYYWDILCGFKLKGPARVHKQTCTCSCKVTPKYESKSAKDKSIAESAELDILIKVNNIRHCENVRIQNTFPI